MANEILFNFAAAQTVYFLIWNRLSQVWNGSSFGAYATGSYSTYTNSAIELGSASSMYAGTFPATIVPGIYSVVAHKQVTGSPLETDPIIATGNIEWNGSALLPQSDLATSGQIATFLPVKLAKGQMIGNFPFKLVSATDHVTVFTSGICSGQIARDSGLFGPLQSGVFLETGLGWYTITLTSGDLNANTAAFVITARGVSGGVSDPRDFGFILQPDS